VSARISIDAEPIVKASRTLGHDGARMVRMGNTTYFHITPEMARQWITVLEPIAEEGMK
jgi:hypothetical protein